MSAPQVKYSILTLRKFAYLSKVLARSSDTLPKSRYRKSGRESLKVDIRLDLKGLRFQHHGWGSVLKAEMVEREHFASMN